MSGWPEAGTSGGMTAAVYDPAGIDQQVVGTTAIQTISNKTLIDPTIAEINGYTLIPGMTTLVDGVAEFGIDNTGTVADNSTAINAALLAGAQGGYGILIPAPGANVAGVIKIQNPIQMGNGGAAVSTTQGGLLVGGGWPGDYYLTGAGPFARGLVTLSWNGSAGGFMCEVLGPLQGWGLRKLYFYGASSAGKCLDVRSAQFGTVIDCTFDSATVKNVDEGCNTVGTFTSSVVDTIHNYWRNIHHVVISGAGGHQFGGTQGVGAVGNTCYELLENVSFVFVGNPSTTTYGIQFVFCDNITVRNAHFASTNRANTVAILVYAESGTTWPADCLVDAPDFGNIGNPIGAGGQAVELASGGGSWQHITVNEPAMTNGTSPNPANVTGGKGSFTWKASNQPTGVIADSPVTFTTGSAWTNVYGVPVTVYLTSGTITGVSIGGSAIGTGAAALAGPWRVAVGQTITFTGTGTIKGDVIGD